MLKGTLQIKNPSKADRDFRRILVQTINKAIKGSIKNIVLNIKTVTETFLRSGSFAKELFHGDLAGHLGLPKGSEISRLNGVISKFVNSIKVEYEPLRINGSSVSNGKLTVGMSKPDFDDLVALDEAFILTAKLDLLNWVEWTLVKGDTIMIVGYDIKFGPGLGRSQQAIMIALGNSSWRVPPPFNGTPDDNWITREVESGLMEYIKILENVINIELKKAAL